MEQKSGLRKFARGIAATATALCLMAASGSALAAGDRGTKEEAKALVERTVADIKKEGAAAVYAKINNKEGGYADRDLYLIIFSTKCVILAHGANAALVDVDMWETADTDGLKFCQKFLEGTQTKPDGNWVDFKFTDPKTKKILPKSNYVIKVGDTMVMAGYYKE